MIVCTWNSDVRAHRQSVLQDITYVNGSMGLWLLPFVTPSAGRLIRRRNTLILVHRCINIFVNGPNETILLPSDVLQIQRRILQGDDLFSGVRRNIRLLGRLPEALKTPSAFLVILENPSVLLHLF